MGPTKSKYDKAVDEKLRKPSNVKKYEKQDQRLMATWAADCAERVLPLFEQVHPQDDRPRKAIKACRDWVRKGVFRMADIRGASLAAHAAAREAQENDPACYAARAAGQAVATAHVPQHAFGAAYYALKAVMAADPAHAEEKVVEEHDWQIRHISPTLRQEVRERVILEERAHGIQVKVHKGKDS